MDWADTIITWPGGQQDQGHGEVLHDTGEGYQEPIQLLGVGVAK